MDNLDFKGPFTSCAVGHFIVSRVPESPPLGITKLIKLVYISHGWCLGVHNRPLIVDPIIAWERGPVMADLYYAVRRTGGNMMYPSRQELFEALEAHKNKHLSEVACQEAKLIDYVVSRYNHFSGNELSEKTHQDESPWYTAIVTGLETINDGLIQKYYGERITAEHTAGYV